LSPNEFPDLGLASGIKTVHIFEKDKENCSRILSEAELIFTSDLMPCTA
jgi:phosphoesterase RecJ-like protein